MMKKTTLALLVFLISLLSFAQDEMSSDTLRKDALNVYMSANDYIRREIPYVNYVRDLNDAQVFIITTSQSTGSGGREYTYFLTGQKEFAGMNDTVSCTYSPDETSDIIRRKQVATLKMALMRYVAETPLAQYINISFTEPIAETVSEDKWDSWVFNSRFSASYNGQKTIKYNSLSGRISADRVTEDLKIRMELYYSYYKNKFILETGDIISENNNKGADLLIVKSISDHWSYGGYIDVGAYTYRNENLRFYGMPAIEWDLYPYSESTRRQLRLLYGVGYKYMDYVETTIYDKTWEHLWQHTFEAAYQVVQKWGSVNVSFEYSNYLHDWSLNNLNFYGSISYRVAKGLNLNFNGNYSIIFDQLALPKGGATPEEILTQRRELETQYSYYFGFGFTYTFGSIYNNVVNPRFGY